jgi:N utilization substance protein B
MNRHEARIMIMAALFNMDINESPLDEVLIYINALVKENLEKEPEEENKNLEFAVDTAKKVLVHLPEIDEIIRRSLINYSIDRLSYVDRAIIRLATFEMLFTDTPHNIVINEAIELTKEYSDIEDGSQVRFNNRLLDTIKESIVNGRK